MLVHPQRVKAIASTRRENDRVDSATSTDLLRNLPEAWIVDAATRELRQAPRLRVSLGQERARWEGASSAPWVSCASESWDRRRKLIRRTWVFGPPLGAGLQRGQQENLDLCEKTKSALG